MFFGGIMVHDRFIRDRITQLRLRKGVSEYKMSYDLGHSRSYVHNISSGKCLPTMSEFLVVCEYLGVTPSQFFDDSVAEPTLVAKAVNEMKTLDAKTLEIVISLLKRLK